MKRFEEPDVNIQRLDFEDVITTSSPTTECQSEGLCPDEGEIEW